MSSEKREVSRPGKENWQSKVGVALVVALGTAIIGFAINGLNDHRKEQEQYVSDQIEKLYGPLFVINKANTAAWAAFKQRHFKDKDSYFVGEEPLTKEKVEIWRNWIRNVFQPQNVQMENAIVSNAHLLIENQVPKVFADLIGHTESYKATIGSWGPAVADDPKTRGSEANTTLINFDNQGKLNGCLQQSYDDLRNLKSRLQDPLTGLFVFRIDEKIPDECK